MGVLGAWDANLGSIHFMTYAQRIHPVRGKQGAHWQIFREEQIITCNVHRGDPSTLTNLVQPLPKLYNVLSKRKKISKCYSFSATVFFRDQPLEGGGGTKTFSRRRPGLPTSFPPEGSLGAGGAVAGRGPGDWRAGGDTGGTEGTGVPPVPSPLLGAAQLFSEHLPPADGGEGST